MKRTVTITGVTSGIGKVCASLLIENGHTVIGIARSQDRLASLERDWGDKLFHPIACDINNHAKIGQAILGLPNRFANIDTLINSAGILGGKVNLADAHDVDVVGVINTNSLALLQLTRIMLPKLIESKRGHLVSISSIAAKYIYPTGNVYAASKAFVEHLMSSIRTEVSGQGVKVTTIRPGQTQTEFYKNIEDNNGTSDRERLSARHVAAAVLWAIDQPESVCINEIEMIPSGSSFANK